MSPAADALLDAVPGQRVAYAEGALLTAEDFGTEQAYHRGRLGRVLAYLHGAGTVAGLDVTVAADEIRVSPGAAIDRLGRIVELERTSCLRLARWLDQQDADVLAAALRTDHLVLDVFASFHPCPASLQPAFAEPGQGTLDAAQPSRVRDGAALTPHLRRPPAAGQADPRPAPDHAFPSLTPAALRTFKRTQLWSRLQPQPDLARDGVVIALGPEHVPGLHDGTELLLARITVPVAQQQGRLRLDTTRPAVPDNEVRLYSYAVAELALLVGLEA